jgi:uncharacterized protein Yka (UPF0111/DUF47 family)
MALLKFPSFLPKENKFCVLLEALATEAGICAQHLKIVVDTSDAGDREKASAAISSSRAKAKTIMTELTRELCRTFVTPFDREDIQGISDDLYKIPKIIEKVKERLSMHEAILTDRTDFMRQVDVIVAEAEAMQDMVGDLVSRRHAPQIQGKIARLYDLEHEGDKVLRELMTSLFKVERPTRDLILRKDIYDMLEKIIDRYRDAAGIALQMVLKHT